MFPFTEPSFCLQTACVLKRKFANNKFVFLLFVASNLNCLENFAVSGVSLVDFTVVSAL